MDIKNVEQCYSKVASKYTESFFDELKNKPLDRYLLDVFCNQIRIGGKVCEVGCGPGHVARYIKDKEIDIFGLDLSEGMIKNARKRNPDIEFLKGNMLELELKVESLAGAVSYYSIVNFTLEEVKKILQNLWTILEDEGILFLGFHEGDEVLNLSNWFEEEMQLDFTFFSIDDIVQILEEQNYKIIEALTRYPYEDCEYMSPKGYIICKKAKDKKL
ncbi:class I SAM-dependent methyltransferase [Vallitalea okinawensis]|uniref:class I SAM-dependent methyltransferase n=1 Tax=Vallitalea okinawensis TaxID=2078660 RepID=UPI000CFB6117|nr:class I SAM-dependent methyltransferase [Vallitalea okinawensis]